MNKKSEIIKDGVLVTISSFIIMAVAFMLYFLIFMFFENMQIRMVLMPSCHQCGLYTGLFGLSFA